MVHGAGCLLPSFSFARAFDAEILRKTQVSWKEEEETELAESAPIVLHVGCLSPLSLCLFACLSLWLFLFLLTALLTNLAGLLRKEEEKNLDGQNITQMHQLSLCTAMLLLLPSRPP